MSAATNVILKHFHGFTEEQWENELRHKFPYCEVEAIAEDLIEVLKQAYELIPDNTESDNLVNIKRILRGEYKPVKNRLDQIKLLCDKLPKEANYFGTVDNIKSLCK